MKSVSDPAVLVDLVRRLNAVGPDTPRKWGTLTTAEMLCHLGDATASVMKHASAEAGAPVIRRRPVMKFIALRSPLRWPRGLKTPARVDPHADGTKPDDFEEARLRAITGLRAFANTPAASLSPSHAAFGKMSAEDWYRWAYRHTDHHLRQFGV